MIYHITTADDWESQAHGTAFVPSDYHKEGFTHCCTEEQIAGVITRYFKGRTGLVVLHLDESRLNAEMKFEISTGDEKFPHVYGAINRQAIIKVTSV